MKKCRLRNIIWILLFYVVVFGIWNGKTIQAQAAHVAHPLCGKASTCVAGTKTHPSVTWQAWNGSSSF